MLDLSFIHSSMFIELTSILVLSAGIGFVGLLLRQPMIVSFIVVGVLSGPSGLAIVRSHDSIEMLAELGISVLLFLVGLKLDLKLIRTLGAVSLVTGLGQVFFTSVIGFFIGISLGFDTITSLYIAVALTFSSTIIIIKLLSDKKEVDSLHGSIAIGFLIVQDLFVVFSMVVLSALGVSPKPESNAWIQIGTILMNCTILLAFIGIFIRYMATPLLTRIARSMELMIVFAISWVALLSTLGAHFGFSKELGGLLAGVSLASTPFREAIVARLSPLRDFLLLFFFIVLGSKLNLGSLGSQMIPALIFSLFILIGNPLIVMALMGYMGYRKRTGFLAGLTVAQISEFSLIFMAMGITLGHINSEALGLVTVVGLITIMLSVYMISYSHTLYQIFEPLLGIFERATSVKGAVHDHQFKKRKSYDLILVGIGRFGSSIAEHLKKNDIKTLIVDFNPDEVRKWKKAGYDTIYGDASDQDFISSLPLKGVKWIVSTMPQRDVNLTHEDPRAVLIDALKREKFAGKIAVCTPQENEIHTLMTKGADLVFLPYKDAADRAVERLREAAS